jgi:hypothetical protein
MVLLLAGGGLIAVLLLSLLGWALWPSGPDADSAAVAEETVAGDAPQATSELVSAEGEPLPAEPGAAPASTARPASDSPPNRVDPTTPQDEPRPQAPAAPAPPTTTIKPGSVSPQGDRDDDDDDHKGKGKGQGKGKGKGKGKKKK